MFPLSTVLFPDAELPLHVFEERYRALMADCLDGDGNSGWSSSPAARRWAAGTSGSTSARWPGSPTWPSWTTAGCWWRRGGGRRLRVDHWLPDDPYPRAVVVDLPGQRDAGGTGDDGAVAAAGAAVRRLRSLLSELGDVPALPHDLDLRRRQRGGRLAPVRVGPLNLMDRQRLLARVGLVARMDSWLRCARR